MHCPEFENINPFSYILKLADPDAITDQVMPGIKYELRLVTVRVIELYFCFANFFIS